MDVTIAWAAGLFEGEGCIAEDKRGMGLLRATLATTDKDVVERFLVAIGVGAIRDTPYKPPLKNQWTWNAFGQDAVYAIETMLPWFGERRTLRAKEVLDARAYLVAQALRERTCPECGCRFCMARLTSGWKLRKYCSKRCSVAHNAPPYELRNKERRNAMARARYWQKKAAA